VFDYYLQKPTNHLLPDQANFGREEGLNRPCKVGSYRPNPLGLYDMHGNALEWCDDAENSADGASQRVLRGGGWYNTSVFCKAAFHFPFSPSQRHAHLGLRVARVPVGKEGK
jgi:formylglycine-generating enzyme required for sulfatase activity